MVNVGKYTIHEFYGFSRNVQHDRLNGPQEILKKPSQSHILYMVE